MANIAKRLKVDEGEGVQLNAFVFASIVIAYLNGDRNRRNTVDNLDEHLERHRASKLDNVDKQDLTDMKAAYDLLTDGEKALHCSKLIAYGYLVQAGIESERFFNRKLRLEPDTP